MRRLDDCMADDTARQTKIMKTIKFALTTLKGTQLAAEIVGIYPDRQIRIFLPDNTVTGRLTKVSPERAKELLKRHAAVAKEYCVVCPSGVYFLNDSGGMACNAALDAAAAADPATQLAIKKEELTMLQYELSAALDCMSHARENAYKSDTGAGWEVAAKHQETAAEIEKIIAAWKSDHPEVMAELEEAEQRKINHLLLND